MTTLPTQSAPIYSLVVPSTKKELKYRPFLVKDEKSLLIAQQSGNETNMLNTIKSVIAACAKSDIDVDQLATFDVEFIFTQMRSVSVGEYVELLFRCDDCEDDPKAQVILQINLLDMKVDTPDGHTTLIPLFDDVGIKMKYPTIDTLNLLDDTSNVEQTSKLMASCIDYIYSGSDMFVAAECSAGELSEFIDNLTSAQFKKIQNFFNTMPSLRQYVRYVCPVCKKDHHKYLEGLSSFF